MASFMPHGHIPSGSSLLAPLSFPNVLNLGYALNSSGEFFKNTDTWGDDVIGLK